MTDRKVIEYPGPWPHGVQKYYPLVYEKESIDVRYYIAGLNEGSVLMWIGSDKPTYRGFSSIKSFRRFVEAMNEAAKELDELIKEGKVKE